MKLVNPIPIFLDGRGALLDAGYIYIGNVGTDPTQVGNQLGLFWDSALTVSAAQPLRTLGGVIVNGFNLGQVYFSATDYSITIQDADQNLVAYQSSSFGNTFQPLNANLTAISAVAATSFGENILEVADAPGLRTYAGLGTISTFNEGTSAEFRSDTAGRALSTDKVWGAAVSVPLTPGATVSIDLSTGFNFTLAMGGNYTLASPTNPKDGQTGKVEITQDATGTRTLAYGANWKFSGGSAPVLSTVANTRDVLEYQCLSDGKVLGSLVKSV